VYLQLWHVNTQPLCLCDDRVVLSKHTTCQANLATCNPVHPPKVPSCCDDVVTCSTPLAPTPGASSTTTCCSCSQAASSWLEALLHWWAAGPADGERVSVLQRRCAVQSTAAIHPTNTAHLAARANTLVQCRARSELLLSWCVCVLQVWS
jgi:hypothetical protein